jgi:type I restriction enzyme, S subunit
MRLDALFNDPRNWLFDKSKFPELRIKDLLVSWFSGGTPTSSEAANWNGGILWASPKDFSDDIVITDTQDRITEAGRHAARLNLAQSGTVLLVVRSGILKHTLPVMVCGREMTVNQDVKALVLRSDISPLFFAEYLQVHQSRILPLITKHGTTVQSVNTNEFERLLIPLPPLDIQHTLVAEMEAARASRRAKLKEADSLLKSLDGWLLAQLDLEPLPADDRKVFAVRFGTLSERRFDPFYYSPSFAVIDRQLNETSNRIVPLTSQLAFPPINGLDARKYEESGQAYLRVQNIRPYEIDASDVRFVNVTHAKEVALQTGDVLLTRKGTFGISAPVTKEHEKALISSEVILLRLSEFAEISTDYLVCWLNSSFAQKLFSRYKTGGIMGHITQDVVKEFPIVVPHAATQQNIIAEMRHLRAEAHRLRAEAEAEWQAAKERFEHQLLMGK